MKVFQDLENFRICYLHYLHDSFLMDNCIITHMFLSACMRPVLFTGTNSYPTSQHVYTSYKSNFRMIRNIGDFGDRS